MPKLLVLVESGTDAPVVNLDTRHASPRHAEQAAREALGPEPKPRSSQPPAWNT